jgi:hypothetical protein
LNNLLFVLPLLLLMPVVFSAIPSLVSATVINTTIANNGTGGPTDKQLESFNACMREQNANGTYNLTPHTTTDLSIDRKLIPSMAEPDKMLTEQELRNEWDENQELYKGDCFRLSDMTPQQLKRAYEGVGFG